MNNKRENTQAEDFAIQQFTGMHYSQGTDVEAVCIGMGLTEDEWEQIKDDCSWLHEWEVEEIENYLKNND